MASYVDAMGGDRAVIISGDRFLPGRGLCAFRQEVREARVTTSTARNLLRGILQNSGRQMAKAE
jgi:hypothetical protein